jgi:electron transfer flavoprotein alpha subunit
MPTTDTEAPNNDTVPPPGAAFSRPLSGYVVMSMFLDLRRDLTELKIDIKHLTTTTESIKGKVEILERKRPQSARQMFTSRPGSTSHW